MKDNKRWIVDKSSVALVLTLLQMGILPNKNTEDGRKWRYFYKYLAEYWWDNYDK